MFITHEIIRRCGWQAFERMISRLLIHKGFKGVRVVGGSGDKGADIIALGPNGKRWLVQAKYWSKPVPESEIRKTFEAARIYKAQVAVMVALHGVDENARTLQRSMLSQGKSLTVWDPTDLVRQAEALPVAVQPRKAQGEYQEAAIEMVHEMLTVGSPRKSMVVMATGLGKTFTAAEAIRRTAQSRPMRVLVLAHTNALVLQLERAFWPFLGPAVSTAVWNQNEKLSDEVLKNCPFIFASRDTVANFVNSGGTLPPFDLVLIDECHHAHNLSTSYMTILNALRAGTNDGPQLLGLTATPFLADSEARLEPVFGESPLVSIDMIYGLQHGFLSQVDYRLFTDNINWDGIQQLKGKALSPKSVNRVFFIKEWDDGVIDQLQETWKEVKTPKAIMFCGTIEHALLMKDKINARAFCKAEAIYSGTARGQSMSQYQKNLVLADFEAGDINVICTVDVFNEGIDVPDVNIVVFNRVTHSRRIFVQQLGRGLRITPGKEKAIALDFAQDIRRYAAGLKMKSSLETPPAGSTVTLGNKVVFRNATGADPKAESFLRSWLSDVERIEAAGDEDVGVLKFPPELH
ncbi:MAG TPA: DEAD/DEAH box helicase family protein [Alloacidobacterium sp.]|nr:DEAD/DEAH box helicase family protein [Alloacidobacterium sp.]